MKSLGPLRRRLHRDRASASIAGQIYGEHLEPEIVSPKATYTQVKSTGQSMIELFYFLIHDLQKTSVLVWLQWDFKGLRHRKPHGSTVIKINGLFHRAAHLHASDLREPQSKASR